MKPLLSPRQHYVDTTKTFILTSSQTFAPPKQFKSILAPNVPIQNMDVIAIVENPSWDIGMISINSMNNRPAMLNIKLEALYRDRKSSP